ncbi:ATP-dependent DNA helicase PcrA [Candidatus Beckwithbacteria bacterium CG10_big_fil_rev_8_21_14_0_10_34_10]|uniref:DNA 3'-5' helicase n=1 Tax=Candidatus Beckwithbacteria bacterium CG10_big_fil_rev_8_21_14_0_10_34_10 TaxID=1974495 RepID=A0A2H0W9J3_9BACT|nr:MAG: ATP-dependent DNA helicase PcrA [Candidatus Beckwithbacteria bacterium CG10_big_fil_rev_8_21_14_0_10_34_10]
MALSLLEDLNQKQIEAVTFLNGPLLILAGAGSGKTRVLTYRTAYFILEKKIEPENILLLTFTNKAALEMKGRIEKLLSFHQQKKRLPFAGTFHSLTAKLLRIEGKELGIPVNFLIFDQKDQTELVKEILKDLDLEKSFKPYSVLNAISGAKNELIGPEEYPRFSQGYFQETVAKVYPEYQKRLKKYQALDFDDLIFKTVLLFWKNKEILNKYRNRFQKILIDEYQDTNQAQYELTKLLSKPNSLTVVGDASQSIYGWRGANFRNVLRLENDFPQLKTINLEQNYRSKQTILDAAHSLISNNTSHPVLKLWTKNKKGEKIKIFEAQSEKDEVSFIINQIQNLLVNGGKDKFSDFAVLYRTNAQSRVLEESFLHLGLPYILVGGTRFYERKEIKDCLAYLRFLLNEKDKISYKRVEKLGKRRLRLFLKLKSNLKNNLNKYSTFKLLNKVIKATRYLEKFDPKNESDLTRLENIKELTSVAREFPKLVEFLENVSLVEQDHLPKNTKKNQKKKKNAVTFMTAHAAKGLEFNTVFMVGMEEGLFPHSKSLLNKEQLEEERRLAYVAITRAKNNLFLSYAKRRLYFGMYSSNQVSRFITEIPSNLLQFTYHEYP